MSYISSFKSGPFEIFKTYKGTGSFSSDGSQTPDTSYDSLCGTRFQVEGDGREVVLVANGAVALAAGVMVQAPAEITAFEKLAMTVPTTTPATAGTFAVLVTNGATVLDINQFKGGYLVVASSTGIGQTLKIASHQAAANGAKFIVTLEDAILTTLSATSIVSLVANPYGSSQQGVIIAPSSETGIPVGATLYAIPASTAATFNATTGALVTQPTPVYGFVVCKGVTGVLVDGTGTNVGYSVGRSASVPGAVGIETLTTIGYVGTAMQTMTSGQVAPIFLNL